MSSSIAKNLSLQSILQVLNVLVPLATSPYLSRVLGPENLGIFSYTQSLSNYFLLIAMLGVINYGTRSIANISNDIKQVSKNFLEIYAIQFTSSLIAIIFYVLFVSTFVFENRLVTYLQGIYIIACIFDVSWLYFGLERFDKIVKITICSRIANVLAIFALVITKDDLLIYVLIMSLGVLFTNLILFLLSFKFIVVRGISIEIKNIFKHIKADLYLFIPILAMSIYHVMDKTMLGMLSSYEQTGFYYNADKLVNIPLAIIVGVATVIFPRISKIFSEGDINRGNQVFLYALELIIVISSALAFGIAGVANNFIPWFFGSGFNPCIYLTMILSPVIIIKGISHIVRVTYLIPKFREDIFIKSVLLGAITNFFLNIFLIPKYGAIGAVLGTLFAELIAMVLQMLMISQIFKPIKLVRLSVPYIIMGSIMFSILRMMDDLFSGYMVLFQIGLGVFIYILILYIYLYIFKRSYLSFLK